MKSAQGAGRLQSLERSIVDEARQPGLHIGTAVRRLEVGFHGGDPV